MRDERLSMRMRLRMRIRLEPNEREKYAWEELNERKRGVLLK